ncbi:FAD-dependent monooxygenase [Streptomyces sp. KL116D]|uniref:FAD-dependent monooxygenase n=1 Tax=Streptomyces sp. KL116D TaxID=3045152 RepID=UPI003557FC5F
MGRRARRAGAQIRSGHRDPPGRGGRDRRTGYGRGGTAALRARYLVGCDGGRSSVRKLAGIGFPARRRR